METQTKPFLAAHHWSSWWRQRSEVIVPLVSGLIQEAAEWIFRGQPLNTLEKQAPIWGETDSSSSLQWTDFCFCSNWISIKSQHLHVLHLLGSFRISSSWWTQTFNSWETTICITDIKNWPSQNFLQLNCDQSAAADYWSHLSIILHWIVQTVEVWVFSVITGLITADGQSASQHVKTSVHNITM